MKVLLDENLPHQLRLEIPGHEVYTVAYMKWAGIENGALLNLAAANGFDVLVTNDRGLEYQQHQNALPLSIIVLLAPTNTVEGIRPLLPELLAALAKLNPKTLVTVSET